jgi:hypothetical protein
MCDGATDQYAGDRSVLQLFEQSLSEGVEPPTNVSLLQIERT